jgi:putative CocE/NonD family hydrolase
MRPHIDHKEGPHQTDESSDTYDTVDWLVKNVPNNNGRVGQYGGSYPGFYCSAGMIDAHPALKAVSPQAPIADLYFDDAFRHGAFLLPHIFSYCTAFGQPRSKPTTLRPPALARLDTPDGYQFFLDLGPLRHVDERYFKGKIPLWGQIVRHPNYDEFWQARNILPHLKKVAPAVMTVGGWFDAEDLYGALNTYRAVERQNPGIFNVLVMGPWQHGGWHPAPNERLGNADFGPDTVTFFQRDIELAFFDRFLQDRQGPALPEATVFETGSNRWRRFDRWPPPLRQKKLYFHAGGRLCFDPPAEDADAHDEYVSDPNKPVPYTDAITPGMTADYMVEDQRFAARRPDVLAYQTDVLAQDVTVAGPLLADLRAATSGTDSDWVVKLIDVLPNDAPDPPGMPRGRHLGGCQTMVRSEVMRGRFRNGYARPEPFVPDEPTRVRLPLQGVLHTFRKGHRIMIQVQSTWFPLVDRNPQRYVDNIFRADETDFIKATQKVFRSRRLPSCVEVGILPAEKPTP